MIINQIVAGGGGTPSGKYQLLQRVTDDSNNEIGTVCGFHTDANNVEYAVVCLDAQYRAANLSFLSSGVTITGLSLFDISGTISLFADKTTATSNNDKVVDFCSGGSDTSDAVAHARSKNFTISGIQYEGQVPTFPELCNIIQYLTQVNNLDSSSASYPSLILKTTSAIYWSSTQRSSTGMWCLRYDAYGSWALNKTTVNNDCLTIPILELPNA